MGEKEKKYETWNNWSEWLEDERSSCTNYTSCYNLTATHMHTAYTNRSECLWFLLFFCCRSKWVAVEQQCALRIIIMYYHFHIQNNSIYEQATKMKKKRRIRNAHLEFVNKEMLVRKHTIHVNVTNFFSSAFFLLLFLLLCIDFIHLLNNLAYSLRFVCNCQWFLKSIKCDVSVTGYTTHVSYNPTKSMQLSMDSFVYLSPLRISWYVRVFFLLSFYSDFVGSMN